MGNLLSLREGTQGEVWCVFARCVEDNSKSSNDSDDKTHCKLRVVGHICRTSTWETEAGEFSQGLGQPFLYGEF